MYSKGQKVQPVKIEFFKRQMYRGLGVSMAARAPSMPSSSRRSSSGRSASTRWKTGRLVTDDRLCSCSLFFAFAGLHIAAWILYKQKKAAYYIGQRTGGRGLTVAFTATVTRSRRSAAFLGRPTGLGSPPALCSSTQPGIFDVGVLYNELRLGAVGQGISRWLWPRGCSHGRSLSVANHT